MKRRLPGIVLCGVAFILAAWLVTTDGVTLRHQLTRWQFGSLEAQAVLFVTLTCLNIRPLIRALRLPRSALLSAAGASALALALVVGVAPRTNRIYYDEHIYQGIGQNLSDLHLAQMCNDGAVEYGILQCWRGEYNKEPYGYPYLLSVGYRLFGVHESVAHRLNAACAVAIVWVVFLTGCALFGYWAGSFAALVMATVPQQLLWSHTAAAEPSAALFAAVAVMTAVHHARARTTRSLLWMVSATVFAVQFRPESLLVAVVVALVLVLMAPDELVRPRFWWAVALALALCAVHLGHLAAVRGERWGSGEAPLSIRHLWPNLQVNGAFYFDNARFPALVTVLALFGLTTRPVRAVIPLTVFFLLLWGVFLFFYAGSYDFGADVRYSLVSHAPLALLAGRGAAWLRDVASKTAVGSHYVPLALVAALCLQLTWFLPQVRAVGEEAWAARADVAFAERVISELPPNSFVLTHNPSIFQLNGVGAAQMSFVEGDPGYVPAVLAHRYSGGVYLHWDAWCGFDDPVLREACGATLRSFTSDVFREYRERDFLYVFYRLRTFGTVRKATSDEDRP